MDVLRSLWIEPRVPDPPARGRWDWLLAVAVLAMTAVEVAFRDDLVWKPAALVLGAVLAAAVLLRRGRPRLAAASGFGAVATLDVAALVADAEPVVLYTAAVVLILAYALVRWGSGRDAAFGLGVIAVTYAAAVVSDDSGLADAIGGAAVLLFAAALGGFIRYRGVSRAQLIQQARMYEREQLARELHDTVAHHVSGIAVQAQAGLYLARSGSLTGATDALEVIDREAVRTLADMRAMVGALRDPSEQPSLAPQHGLADLRGLAARSAAAPPVEVALAGDLHGLSPALEATLYRIAQESVTNAQRHAREATRIEVRVTGTTRDIELLVNDDGARASAGAAGYGLVGMNERVTLLGGAFTAGPRPDRGWSVRAVLPRERSPR